MTVWTIAKGVCLGILLAGVVMAALALVVSFVGGFGA